MNKLQSSLLISFAISVIGCSTVKPINPLPVFEPSNIAVTIDKETHHLSESDVKCDMPKEIWKKNVLPSAYSQFLISAVCAFRETQDQASDKFSRFTIDGVAFSNHSCEDFFNILEDRRTQSDVSKSAVNVAGSAITAALAEAGGHQRSIFNLATVMTAGNAGFEVYRAAFLLTPDLKQLRDLIQTGRTTRADAMRQKALEKKYTSYTQVKEDLIAYDELCSHKVLVDVVNKSLANNKFTFPKQGIPYETRKANADTKRKMCETAEVEVASCTDEKFGMLVAFADFDLSDRKILKSLLELKSVPPDMEAIKPFVTKLELAEPSDKGRASVAAIRKMGIELGLSTDPGVALYVLAYQHLLQITSLKAEIAKAQDSSAVSAGKKDSEKKVVETMQKELNATLAKMKDRIDLLSTTKETKAQSANKPTVDHTISFAYEIVPK